jgi:hypothetical protein
MIFEVRNPQRIFLASTRRVRRRSSSRVEHINRRWSLITTQRYTSMHRLEAKKKEENKDLKNPIQARHFIKERYL